MTAEYDHRLRAVEDSIRLVRTMTEPSRTANIGTYMSSTGPLMDRFDVLEVARFLLDEEDATATWVLCRDCGEKTNPGTLTSVAAPCPTCSGPIRETVGMVCQTCGTDYGRAS